MKRIQFKERVSLNGHMYQMGDLASLEDEDAKLVCSHGWGDDVDGELPTGERSTAPKELSVKKLAHKNKASKIGGEA